MREEGTRLFLCLGVTVGVGGLFVCAHVYVFAQVRRSLTEVVWAVDIQRKGYITQNEYILWVRIARLCS